MVFSSVEKTVNIFLDNKLEFLRDITGHMLISSNTMKLKETLFKKNIFEQPNA